jgi:hypothetical protein
VSCVYAYVYQLFMQVTAGVFLMNLVELDAPPFGLLMDFIDTRLHSRFH